MSCAGSCSFVQLAYCSACTICQSCQNTVSGCRHELSFISNIRKKQRRKLNFPPWVSYVFGATSFIFYRNLHREKMSGTFWGPRFTFDYAYGIAACIYKLHMPLHLDCLSQKFLSEVLSLTIHFISGRIASL